MNKYLLLIIYLALCATGIFLLWLIMVTVRPTFPSLIGRSDILASSFVFMLGAHGLFALLRSWNKNKQSSGILGMFKSAKPVDKDNEPKE